jgi:hypothetical protein
MDYCVSSAEVWLVLAVNKHKYNNKHLLPSSGSLHLYHDILQACGLTDIWSTGKEYAVACSEEIRPKKYRQKQDSVGFPAFVEQGTVLTNRRWEQE